MHSSPQFALYAAQYVQKVARLWGEERIGCQIPTSAILSGHRDCGGPKQSDTAKL